MFIELELNADLVQGADVRSTCVTTFAAVWILILAFNANCFGADSCDPIRTFADGKQPLREIFVSPTGNNSTGNGTQANPYQTISRALQGVQPGDAIRLLPGTYSAGTFIGNLAGTSNSPINLYQR